MARWKFEVGAAVIANSQAPGDWPGKTGVIAERGPGRTEYGVRAEGSEVTEYVNSWWVDHIALAQSPTPRPSASV